MSEVGLHGFQVRRSPERVINVHEGSAVSGGFEFQFSIILWAEPRIKVMWITLKGLEVCWACIRIRRIGLFQDWWLCSVGHRSSNHTLLLLSRTSSSSYICRGFGPQQRASGVTAGQGSGQGAIYGRAGFPRASQGFRPGFVGRGPYLSNGGGRYGARGRPAGWPAQACGGFQGHRGPMAGNNSS
jgi:hypothetical protein